MDFCELYSNTKIEEVKLFSKLQYNNVNLLQPKITLYKYNNWIYHIIIYLSTSQFNLTNLNQHIHDRHHNAKLKS